MEIKTDSQKLIQSQEKKAKKLVKRIQNALQEWGNSTIESAKKRKPYRRRSGNLDKSQKAHVDGLGVMISIDPSIVTRPRVVNGKTVTPEIDYGALQHNRDPWLSKEIQKKKKALAKEIGKIIVETL